MDSETWGSDSSVQGLQEQHTLTQTTLKTPSCGPNISGAMTTSETVRLSQSLNKLLSQMNQSLSETNCFRSYLQAHGLGSDAVLTWQSGLQNTSSTQNLLAISDVPTLMPSRMTTVKSDDPISSTGCVKPLIEKGDRNNELCRVFDGISKAQEWLRAELERSHCSKTDVATVLKGMRDQTKIQDSQEIQYHRKEVSSLCSDILVKKHTPKFEENEPEAQVDSMQIATASLEKAYLNLYKKLQLQRNQETNKTATQVLLIALPKEKDRVSEEQEKENEMESIFLSKIQSLKTTDSHADIKKLIIRYKLQDKELLTTNLKDSNDGMAPSEEKYKEVIKVFEERLQLKDREIQENKQLLIAREQKLEEITYRSELKDTEIRSLAETLQREKKQNLETLSNFEKTCSSWKDKFLEAKSEYETAVQKLKHQLEKYAKLKDFARSVREQAAQSSAEKGHFLKRLDAAKHELESLRNEQSLLKEEKEAALFALADLKEDMRHLRQDHSRTIEEKWRLEEMVSRMKDEIESLKKQLQNVKQETQRAVDVASIQESEKESYKKGVEELKDTVGELQKKIEDLITEKESTSIQMEVMKQEAEEIQNKLQEDIQHIKQEQETTERTAADLRKESDALNRFVVDLKEDKCMLKGELEEVLQEKYHLEAKFQDLNQEGDKLRGVISMLERERNVLLAELCDLRMDYLNLSDRIADRMKQMCHESSHMSNQELKLSNDEVLPHMSQQNIQNRDPKEEVIIQIKQRLEEEEGRAAKRTLSGPPSSSGTREKSKERTDTLSLHATSTKEPVR
ncbi:coiled-coil domain-containing protein 110 isoform X1 [Lepisosteus oculatus]|uniref:coiled-coil domain-containing protein 110 isoform X1 n=1 Tax=Lepisosteus oculatus TaxID=7918 RepID=UPI0037157BB4